MIAPDRRRFVELIGPHAPEYGAAIAVPSEQRIVMQGSRAGSDAGDPRQVLRHELAHLALHEAMGDLPPRWFDEGYASLAAGEWGREEVIVTNLALAWRGLPSLDALDAAFMGGSARASGCVRTRAPCCRGTGGAGSGAGTGLCSSGIGATAANWIRRFAARST